MAHLLQPEANHKPCPPSCGSLTWEGNTARLKQSAKRAGGGAQGMATAILMPLEAAVQYETNQGSGESDGYLDPAMKSATAME